MYRNKNHVTIQSLKQRYNTYAKLLGDLEAQVEDSTLQQFDVAFENLDSVNFKLLHPLLIKGYKVPKVRYGENPINLVGLDVETEHTSGKPMLYGFWYPKGEYHKVHKPSLESFFRVIKSISDNGTKYHLATWGNLDIQTIIRLFEPDETELKRISRGLSGKIDSEGNIAAPIVREIKGQDNENKNKKAKYSFYVAHYMAGRSLRLAWTINDETTGKAKYEQSVWVFNMSQFFPGTIAQTAKGLKLEWKDFGKETHLIDWNRYNRSVAYRQAVHSSNKQDARIVMELGHKIQEQFYNVFEAYPTLLVSTGSLVDAAISKILDNETTDYESNSWAWLKYNIWSTNESATYVELAEDLLAKAYSAGYVDQFAVGYFDKVHTADIASAYPHKIRELPDLRQSYLRYGEGELEKDLESQKGIVETAIIEGKVNIPESLKFHPITVRSFSRENYRPVGTFYAAYTLEERRFCESYGATFEDEKYVIVYLDEWKQASIGQVSSKLGQYRQDTLEKMKVASGDEKLLLDGQQFVIKVIDNSIYGKTVMTTENMELINGVPTITGYIAGDRFNMLYGTLITARTRIQIAKACMHLYKQGNMPIMAMTDSVYWYGDKDGLNDSGMVWTESKRTGWFEAPESVEDFYILKTGQYEYRKDKKYTYKVRGLNVDWEYLSGTESFFRKAIKEYTKGLPRHTSPKSIEIPFETRKLITVGMNSPDTLGLVSSGETRLKPFVLSSKQVEKTVRNWRECLDSHIWLETPKLSLNQKGQNMDASGTSTPPMAWLSNEYKTQAQIRKERKLTQLGNRVSRVRERKMQYIVIAQERSGRSYEGLDRMAEGRRWYEMRWEELEAYFGIDAETLLGKFRKDVVENDTSTG